MFRITGFLGLLAILFAVSACLDLEPDTATNPVGTEHTVTVTVETEQGPPEGVLITFEVISGPNQGEVSDPNTGECSPDDCTTDAIGEVSWTYSSEVAGTDIIIASTFDEQDELVESDPVEKIWVLPIPTLNEWGLIALATILGIVGIMVMRRRMAAV